jgi:hypothetical protein
MDMAKGRALTRTSVFVGEDQIEALRRLTEETGIPMSFVIRRGIDIALANYRVGVSGREVGMKDCPDEVATSGQSRVT